jgi:ribonucleoside-triphosphate reductase
MPKCSRTTEVWSRVCGFFRPAQQWNKGKQEEYRDRTPYFSSHQDTKITKKGNGHGDQKTD